MLFIRGLGKRKLRALLLNGSFHWDYMGRQRVFPDGYVGMHRFYSALNMSFLRIPILLQKYCSALQLKRQSRILVHRRWTGVSTHTVVKIKSFFLLLSGSAYLLQVRNCVAHRLEQVLIFHICKMPRKVRIS